MSEPKTTANNDSVSKSTLIASVIGAVVATVVALEFTGKIKHNEAKDEYPVSSYQAILINKGEEHLISQKPSNQTAQCIDGYLFIQSDDDLMQGLIVDYKNRGVRC
ncbi:hypothetical protein [Alkalimarinus sediminis]|uniref:Kinase n=1 Tax=Alkalimarinus sediminis TaxID=1632866 RepID=A0A9E8HH42_9ALTE|nr:hypothetical protein [Alkalimarinus sediminis]UZW74087.1 hypothetical protein NNL22_13775 [Alkalimarinus sediminis]